MKRYQEFYGNTSFFASEFRHLERDGKSMKSVFSHSCAKCYFVLLINLIAIEMLSQINFLLAIRRVGF